MAVVSADSHPVSGAFSFAVGTISAAPASAATTYAGSGTAVALGLSRWAGYLGLPLSQVGRWDLVTEVIGTTYGKALVTRLILLAGIAIWLGRRSRTPGTTRPPGARSRWVGALVAAALLATFSATGHAVAGSGRVLAFPVDMAHLAAMAVWVGGLAMLTTVLLRRGQAADAAEGVPVFSRVAGGAVAVLVVTGSYQTWRQVGGLPALAATTYGRELIVKLGLVAVAVSFGATSRAWVRRHHGSPPVVYAASATDLDPRPPDGPAEVTPAAVRTLRRSVVAEAVIAMLILAVTAALVATVPARTAYRPTVDETIRLGPDTARVSAVPAGDREMDLHVFFFGPSGAPPNPNRSP